MHKKSAGTIRKAECEEKLAALWGSEHLKESSSPRQAGPQRGLEEGSPVSIVEDMVIDLSSSTRQETERMQQGAGAQGRPDSEGLEGLQPGKEGALWNRRPLPPTCKGWKYAHSSPAFFKRQTLSKTMLSAGFSPSCVRIKCNVTCFKKTNGDSWNIPLHSRMEITPWRHVNQLIRSKTFILFYR